MDFFLHTDKKPSSGRLCYCGMEKLNQTFPCESFISLSVLLYMLQVTYQ